MCRLKQRINHRRWTGEGYANFYPFLQHAHSRRDTLYELENTKETRGLIGLKAKGKDNKKGWFKSIGHGEVLGRVWFSSLNEIEETHLKAQYDGLMNWIDRK